MSNTIKQLEERVVATEIVLMRWSDRMDLLALANIRGEVSLHRLTWQKVWSLPPDKESVSVVDLCWRPDGKILAIAYNYGNVVLVEVENKNVLHTISIEDRISCVVWQQNNNNAEVAYNDSINNKLASQHVVRDSSKFLPELPSLSSEFSPASKSPVENLFDLNFVRNQIDLNILIIGTKSGLLHISVFGLFTCAIVNVSENLNKVCEILSVQMSENLDFVYVTLCDDSKNLQGIVINTSILNTHSKELFTMALKYGNLVSLVSYLDNTMSSITEAYESILLEMDSKLSKYASKVAEGTVSADFMALLITGIPSEEMEEFLLQDLTDKGLKKLGQSIELSYSNIQKLLLKHLTQVGENITYHLSELRGMARFTYRYGCLGLKEKTISSAIMANGAFLAKGVEVQQVINNSMTNYKAFFRWLYVVILRLMEEPVPPEIPEISQQDVSYITEQVTNFDHIGSSSSGQKGRFNLERLGQYLSDSPITISTKNGNIWSNFIEVNECISEHDSIIKHCESMSLVQQYKCLVNSIDGIFIEPKELMSQNFKIALNISCINISDINNIQISQYNFNENITLTAFIDTQSSLDGIQFIEVDSSNGLSVKCAYLYFSKIPDPSAENTPCKILDITFYSSTYLSVLLEENSENKTACFCQIPIANIRTDTSEVTVANNTLILHSDINKIDICDIPGNIVKPIEGMVASAFAVSGSRHVSVVLSENKRKVQLFEMEADEEEEDLEDTYMTANTTRDNESMLQESIISE